MFQLADKPYLFPGHTLLGDTRGPVVDTGIELPVGGRVYLTKLECSEAARLFGFATPEQLDAEKAARAAAERQVLQLELRISQMGRLFNEDLEDDARAAA